MENLKHYIETSQIVIISLIEIKENLFIWRTSPLANLNPIKIFSVLEEYNTNIGSNFTNSAIINSTKKEARDFLVVEYECIKLLHYDKFREWHMKLVSEIIGFTLDFQIHTISDIVKNPNSFIETLKKLKQVAESAKRGSYIEETLNEIHSRLQTCECNVIAYSGNVKLLIIESFLDLDFINGDLLTLGIFDASDKYLRVPIENLTNELKCAGKFLEEWKLMQPLMIKCYSFFESDDVKIQLYTQLKRFGAFERLYRSLLDIVVRTGNLASLIEEAPDINSAVSDLAEGLQKLVIDINFWLDNIRKAFPRLYFINDNELLDLLAIGHNPQKFSNQALKKYIFLTIDCSSLRHLYLLIPIISNLFKALMAK